MAAVTIESGTRMQLAYSPAPGAEAKFDMMATFFRAVDESAFLVSIPLVGGRPLEVDENQKLLFRYAIGDEFMVLAGYRDDTVKVGVRRYWKIRRVAEQRQFAQRVDERLKVALRVEFDQPTWPVNDQGKTDREDAMTLDISAGGVALYMNRRFEVGESCSLYLPRVGGTAEGKPPQDLVGVICWQREAPKGSLYRIVSGLQFRLDNPAEKERVNEYVAAVKAAYKL